MGKLARAWDWLTTVDPLPNVPDVERGDVYDAHEWLEAHPDLMPAGFAIDARTALGLPAFNRALRIKSGLISTLPLRIELDGRMLGDVPQILAQPDPLEDRQTTLSRMVASLTLRGELVAVIGYDAVGFPEQIKVVDPLTAVAEDDGTWTIAGRRYDRDEVLHRAPFLMPGASRGCGAIELHRRHLDGQIRQADYQRAFYRDAGMPSVQISVARPGLSVGEMQEYADWWDRQLRGRRKAMVVDGDTTASAMGLSNQDAQYLETLQYNLAECALMIGVPPYFVGAAVAGMTYSNAHHERRNLLDVHLRDELVCIERAFSALLPDGMTARFDPADFLKLDPQATVAMLAQASWLTDDERRAVMGYDPLGGGEGASPGEIARLLQQIYLAVGNVITPDEARDIANRAGAALPTLTADQLATLGKGAAAPAPVPTPNPEGEQ